MAGFPFLAGRHLLLMKSSRPRDQSRSAPLLHTPGTPAIEEEQFFRRMEEGRRPPPTQPTAAHKRFWAIFIRVRAGYYISFLDDPLLLSTSSIARLFPLNPPRGRVVRYYVVLTDSL